MSENLNGGTIGIRSDTTATRIPTGGVGLSESLNPKVKVRAAGSHRRALQSDFDVVPCAMRLTMPGTRRLQNPVQGRRDGVNKNEDVLVWCDCMAQTAEQHKIALDVVERGLNPDDVAWPTPKHQRGWDVLGAVSVRDDDRVTEAVRMWKEHVAKRRALIESRSAT